jgi:hypothetical protein
MRTTLLRVACASLFLLGCHRSDADYDEPLLPDDWDSISSRLDPCLGTPPFVPVPEEHAEWVLREPAGVLRLPAGFREISNGKRGVRTWAGPDSSRFELSVTQTPSGGLASSANVVMENQCALAVAGHRAFTARLRLDDTTAARSVYLADATVVIRERMALNVWIESESALTRERLLHAFSALELTDAQ